MFKFNNKVDIMTNKDIILAELREFEGSTKRQWMLKGEAYYQVDNDIKDRVFYTYKDEKKILDTDRVNNKLSHADYKNQVDDKINYLLGRPYTLKCENEEYLAQVTKALGKHFIDTLNELGYEASNKGIGWLQVYLDEEGKFKTMVIPSEQVVPIWKDRSHKELTAVIRQYEQIEYIGKERKTVKKVEYWTKETVEYYIRKDNELILDSEMYLNAGEGDLGHFTEDGLASNWGRVPFIAFKNNWLELPDLKFVKSLIDNYDLSRSEAANYVEAVQNLIYVLKGYGGENLDEFISDLKKYRAVKIDDPAEGGLDTLTPTMDITALKEHYEQLKRDIIESGQGVNKKFDNTGAAPSGIALKFLYSGLDLKCNGLETPFKRAFEDLLYFINVFLGKKLVIEDGEETENVEIIFNRDITINEKEAIEDCQNSKGIISHRTIVANHPWVVDIEEELRALEEEELSELNSLKDAVPFNKPVNDGEE